MQTSIENHRDADTWGVRLLELQDQGFQPEATVADAGRGIRAGQALAMPETPCRGDVFHILQTVQSLATFLENRAYATITATADLERKKARLEWRGQRTLSVAVKLGHAQRKEAWTLVVDYTHDIDILRHLAGEVHEVSAMAARLGQLDHMADPNVVDILLAFRSGTVGSIHMDYVRHPEKKSLELIGDRLGGTVGARSPAEQGSRHWRIA